MVVVALAMALPPDSLEDHGGLAAAYFIDDM